MSDAVRVAKLSLEEASAALFGERSGEAPATAPSLPEEPPRRSSRSEERRDDEEERKEDKPEGPSAPEPPAEPGAAEPEQPPAAEVTDDPEYEIRVGDKTESVKLSELQNGYLRQADYSRKTMEAAQVRKDYEQAVASLADERRTYGTLLKELKRQVEAGMTPPAEMERLKSLDPVGYMMAKEQQRERQEYLSAIQQEESAAQARQQQEHQRWLSQARSDAQAVILRQIPSWQQEEVRNREISELAKVGTEIYGYTTQELAQVLDPRFVLMARDAMLYRQGQGRTNGVAAKRVTPQPGRPVPAKRSTPQTDPNATRREAAQQRFNRSPTLNSAVDAVMAERGINE